MRWETKVRLIMMVLSPPLWVGCKLLLVGIYIYVLIIRAFEHTKRIGGELGAMAKGAWRKRLSPS